MCNKGVGDKTWLVVAFCLRPAVSEDIGAKSRFFGEGGTATNNDV